MKVLIFLFLLPLNFISAQEVNIKNIVCYFTSWSTYRPGNGKFDVGNINPSLCTHINYAYLGVYDNASIEIRDPWETDGLHAFTQLVDLKKVNTNLKIIMSIGGMSQYSATFSAIAADETLRQNFADNAVDFLAQHSFDGIDIDWEIDGSNPDDKDLLTELLKVLSNTLQSKGYILSLAVSGNSYVCERAYNVEAISKLVDMINVKTFDYHGYWDNFIGHGSPLYAAVEDAYIDLRLNADVGINYWVWHMPVADKQKINWGIPTFGRSFTLADKTNTSLYAPILGAGVAGPYSGESGLLAYNEICEYHSNSTYVWDDQQKVPHRIWDDQWVGFEDNSSLSPKLYSANRLGLGGIMIYTLDFDDFNGQCGEAYGLLGYINSYFK